mmetsp:Transcript_37979/g.65118  ORF Transcript_37979/g.65118 Transcript_37979/m.65118 type:complete len:224 (+) Transcript_37979:672-1343(+)
MVDELRVALQLAEHLQLLPRHKRAAEGLAHELPHLGPLDVVRTHRVVPKHLKRVVAVRVEPQDFVLARVEQRRRRSQQLRLEAHQPQLLLEPEQPCRAAVVRLRELERLRVRHERAEAHALQLRNLCVPLGVALAQHRQRWGCHPLATRLPHGHQLGGRLLWQVVPDGHPCPGQQQAEQVVLMQRRLRRPLHRIDQEGHEWVHSRGLVLVQVVYDEERRAAVC